MLTKGLLKAMGREILLIATETQRHREDTEQALILRVFMFLRQKYFKLQMIPQLIRDLNIFTFFKRKIEKNGE